MVKRIVFGMIPTLLLIGMLTLAFNIELVEAEPKTIYVDDDNTTGPWDGTPEHPYQNITSGLEHAVPGDTVFVFNGTYTESIVIDEALNLTGESNIATIIDAGGVTQTINIIVNNVSLSGFNVKNGNYGTCGVRLYGVNGCRIFENRFTRLFVAVGAEYSINNTISDNYIEDLSHPAIVIFHSHNNTVSGNTITSVSPTVWEDGAISIEADSTGNTVASNNITDVSDIAAIWISGDDTYNNIVSQNYIEDCERGIDLYYGTYENILMDNVITYCRIKSPGEYGGYGIAVGFSENCDRNVIIRNNITKSEKDGIHISHYCEDNVIYHNYVVDNSRNAYDYTGNNDWDNGYPSGGNYWGDYTGLDLYRGPYQNETGNDGIGDTPYNTVGSGVDHYPLMNPWAPPDIAVINVVPSETVVEPGSSLCINVTTQNQGNKIEQFNVTAYANTITIATFENITLVGGTSTNITFTWNTTSFAKGDYTISAYAWPVPGEADTDDNLYVDGNVQILGWTISFIGLGGYPVVDFAVYNGNLYAASDNTLYLFNGSSWTIIDAPTYVLSLEPHEDKLIIGGKNALYSYNGTTFTLIFTVPNYIKPLGVYNNTLYAGTVLDKPPTLYYCNGSAENPANWHTDTAFSTILNFSGPFGSIDSFTVYNNNMYITSGGTVYCYNGTHWNITKAYDDVCAYLDMKIYNGKLYLATRDQAWRKPYYQGYSGFSGRVIEFDGNNWTTIFDHDYWIYSLETYAGKLYVGTANKIYTYNGTHWDTSFNSELGAYYAISFATFNNTIYAGMGNGYILADPSTEKANSTTTAVPEFSSLTLILLFMTATLLIAIVYRKKQLK